MRSASLGISKRRRIVKYTFVNKNKQEQTIDIPEEFIVRTRRALGCDIKEACEIYLSDEGYIDNEVVDEINAIVNENKKRRGPKRKPDYIKQALIASIYEDLQQIDGLLDPDGEEIADGPQNITITNPERIVQFSINDDTYEITLSRKRKPKA